VAIVVDAGKGNDEIAKGGEVVCERRLIPVHRIER
jgi:hypothetical protein